MWKSNPPDGLGPLYPKPHDCLTPYLFNRCSGRRKVFLSVSPDRYRRIDNPNQTKKARNQQTAGGLMGQCPLALNCMWRVISPIPKRSSSPLYTSSTDHIVPTLQTHCPLLGLVCRLSNVLYADSLRVTSLSLGRLGVPLVGRDTP